MSRDEDELIARFIEPPPAGGEPADARVVDAGVHVWALVGYWLAADKDIDRTAADYDVPPAAVEAAIAYYRAGPNKDAIDARLALHAASFAMAG